MKSSKRPLVLFLLFTAAVISGPLYSKDLNETCVPLVENATVTAGKFHRVLDRIVGHVAFGLQQGRVTADFQHLIDQESRKNAGEGTELVNLLSAHVTPGSITAVRVEEKSVVKKENHENFLAVSQSAEFAARIGSAQPVKWDLRDRPPEGKSFATLTEYGKNLVFSLPQTQSTFVVKPRKRKYFEFDPGAPSDLSKYKAVMGNIAVFELKMTSLSGPDDGSLLSTPDSVFKPRIFVTDEVADGIMGLKGNDPELATKLQELRATALTMTNAKGEPLNKASEVESMFDAIAFLLAKDPDFLTPTFLVRYNRSSYRYRNGNTEYQYTADQDVAIYRPFTNHKTEQMLLQLVQEPLFASPPGEAFVELKSPPSEKKGATPLYTALYNEMTSRHLVNYKQGQGKYAIARFVDRGMLDQHLDRTLLEQGTLYWIIKGTSNLDAPPRKRDILERGEIQVTYPFPAENGRMYRVMFEYRQLNTFNGRREGILTKIKLFDNHGEEIKMRSGFGDSIRQAYERPGDVILGLNLGGTVIPFKVRITPDEMDKYQRFFSTFFEYETHLGGRPRSLESFEDIRNHRDISRRGSRLKVENAIHFLIERTKRVSLGAVITLATVTAYSHLTGAPQQPQMGVVEPPQSQQSQHSADTYMIMGLRDGVNGEIPLQPVETGDGRFYFVPPAAVQQVIRNMNYYQLFDSTGRGYVFKVIVQDSGRVVLALVTAEGNIA